MSGVRRIYVEKKEAFAGGAKEVRHDLRHYLGITGVEAVRRLIRYDVEGVSGETFEKACVTVFSEPPVDVLYRETLDVPAGSRIFSVEALPGQFDQRADSAEQCIRFIREDETPVIRTAVTYIITGDISDSAHRHSSVTQNCYPMPKLLQPRRYRPIFPLLPCPRTR